MTKFIFVAQEVRSDMKLTVVIFLIFLFFFKFEVALLVHQNMKKICLWTDGKAGISNEKV